MQHHGVNVDPVRFGHDDDARRVFVIGLVAQVDNHRQLFLLHLRGDLFEHFGARHLKRQRRDNNLVAFGHIHRARLERATTGAVHRLDFAFRRDQLRLGRVVGALNNLADVFERRLGSIEQMNSRVSNLAQIVRRNVGCHADRDAAAAVEQDIWQPRGQHLGLVHRAIEIGFPVDGTLSKLTE